MKKDKLKEAPFKLVLISAFLFFLLAAARVSAALENKTDQRPAETGHAIRTILPEFPYWVAAGALTAGKDRIVFEGAVDLEVDPSTTFHGDKLLIHLADSRITDVELLGGVMMTVKKGDGLTIKSQRASSDNFPTYVVFSGKVIVRKGVLEIKAKKIRYNLLSEELTQE